MATTEKVDAEISKLLPATPFIRHLYLTDSAGQLLGVGHAERALQDFPLDWYPVLQTAVKVNLGGELRRVFLESDNGIVVLLCIAQNRWLIGVCDKGASLGTVSVGVGKLIARLIPPQGNGLPDESAADSVVPQQLRASGM